MRLLRSWISRWMSRLNMSPVIPSRTQVMQLSDDEANFVGRAVYYASRTCSDGCGGIFKWEKLSNSERLYWVGLAGAALTADAQLQGWEIVPRRTCF